MQHWMLASAFSAAVLAPFGIAAPTSANEAAIGADLAVSRVFGEAQLATCDRTGGAKNAPVTLAEGVLIDNDGISVRVHTGSSESGDGTDLGGRTVYTGSEKQTSTVIQNCLGMTQIIKVIEGPSAPASYALRFDLAPGMRLAEDSSGGIVIEQDDEVVGSIEAPWATDSNGARVPTKYTVKENALIKTVSHKGAAYPVVADPTISIGRYWYVRYNRDEVRRINVTLSTAGNRAALVAACALITRSPLAAACVALGEPYIASVMGQIRDAQREGKCILHRYSLVGAILVHWDKYNC